MKKELKMLTEDEQQFILVIIAANGGQETLRILHHAWK